MSFVPDIEDAYRQAREVIEIIDAAESARLTVDRFRHGLTSMAAVSRCRSLLLGVIRLDETGRADLVGVLLRALLEVWYFGVIALLGDASDLERLEADHRFWRNHLARALPGIAPQPGPDETFSIRQRAIRADELVIEIGEPAGSTLEWYQTIYASESLTNAHAGFESLRPYVFEDPDGTIGIVHETVVDEGLRYGRLRLATVMTALLAKWTWDRVGLNGAAFDEIEGLGDPD